VRFELTLPALSVPSFYPLDYLTTEAQSSKQEYLS